MTRIRFSSVVVVGVEAVVVELFPLCSLSMEVEEGLEVALGFLASLVLEVEVVVLVVEELVMLLSPSSLTESKEAWAEEED